MKKGKTEIIYFFEREWFEDYITIEIEKEYSWSFSSSLKKEEIIYTNKT